MTSCLPTRLTTTAITCPRRSCTLRGGNAHWPGQEWTLFTFGSEASGTTSTWSWDLPATWWPQALSFRRWERQALSQCRLFRLRSSASIKAPYDPTKILQWPFPPAKVWWVQLLPPAVWPRGQWCVKGERWQISLEIVWLILHYCSADIFDL